MSTVSRRNFVSGAAAAAGCAALFATGCSAQTSAEENESTSTVSGESSESLPKAAGIGQAEGKAGLIVLEALFEGDALIDINYTRNHETPACGGVALTMLKDMVIEGQSLNVDTISSATISSAGFKTALANAIDDAGFDSNEWKERDAVKITRDVEVPTDADIIVVGSGGTGLVAALEGALAGKNVVVLEKMNILGGSTNLSGAGIAIPGCWIQKDAGIEDSPELMTSDMIVGGDNLGDPELVSQISNNILTDTQWLTWRAGIEWDTLLAIMGGHSVKRTVRPSHEIVNNESVGTSGSQLIRKLTTACEKAGATLLTDMDVTSLITNENGDVTGVAVQDTCNEQELSISAPSVILATGGFGANLEMVGENDPNLAQGFKSTDCISAQGDGIVMAQEIGAATVDMEYVQTHPMTDVQTGAMLGGISMTRYNGNGIIVNKEGDRFCEELETRLTLSTAENKQTDGIVYVVTDSTGATIEQMGNDSCSSLISRNLLAYGDTLEEACEPFGIDATELQVTLDTWNTDVDAGADSQFNYRNAMQKISTPPYFVMAMTPGIHYTMGGIKINANTEVLNEDGKVINGLYAAGETAGGIMGNNRLGSTAVADIIVNGRIAAKNAAKATSDTK